jgi:hypothetical protein
VHDFHLGFGGVVHSLKDLVDLELLLFHGHWLLRVFVFSLLLLLFFCFFCLLLFFLRVTFRFLFERELDFDPVVLLEVTWDRDFNN